MIHKWSAQANQLVQHHSNGYHFLNCPVPHRNPCRNQRKAPDSARMAAAYMLVLELEFDSFLNQKPPSSDLLLHRFRLMSGPKFSNTRLRSSTSLASPCRTACPILISNYLQLKIQILYLHTNIFGTFFKLLMHQQDHTTGWNFSLGRIKKTRSSKVYTTLWKKWILAKIKKTLQF